MYTYKRGLESTHSPCSATGTTMASEWEIRQKEREEYLKDRRQTRTNLWSNHRNSCSFDSILALVHEVMIWSINVWRMGKILYKRNVPSTTTDGVSSNVDYWWKYTTKNEGVVDMLLRVTYNALRQNEYNSIQVAELRQVYAHRFKIPSEQTTTMAIDIDYIIQSLCTDIGSQVNPFAWWGRFRSVCCGQPDCDRPVDRLEITYSDDALWGNENILKKKAEGIIQDIFGAHNRNKKEICSHCGTIREMKFTKTILAPLLLLCHVVPMEKRYITVDPNSKQLIRVEAFNDYVYRLVGLIALRSSHYVTYIRRGAWFLYDDTKNGKLEKLQPSLFDSTNLYETVVSLLYIRESISDDNTDAENIHANPESRSNT